VDRGHEAGASSSGHLGKHETSSPTMDPSNSLLIAADSSCFSRRSHPTCCFFALPLHLCSASAPAHHAIFAPQTRSSHRLLASSHKSRRNGRPLPVSRRRSTEGRLRFSRGTLRHQRHQEPISDATLCWILLEPAASCRRHEDAACSLGAAMTSFAWKTAATLFVSGCGRMARCLMLSAGLSA